MSISKKLLLVFLSYTFSSIFIFADKKVDKVFVRTAPRTLNYALSRYQNYLKENCNFSFDFQITPFFSYLSTMKGNELKDAIEKSYRMFGLYSQGRLNFYDAYVDVNGTFGDFKQEGFASSGLK